MGCPCLSPPVGSARATPSGRLLICLSQSQSPCHAELSSMGEWGCCTALVPSEHISLKGCYPGIRQPVGCVAKAWWKRDVFALLAGPAPSRRFFWPNFWVPGGLYHVVLAPAVVLAGCTQPELAVCSSQRKLGLETLAETERYVYGERATLPQ